LILRPAIKWLKDGKPLKLDEPDGNKRMKMVEPDGETVALIISKV